MRIIIRDFFTFNTIYNNMIEEYRRMEKITSVELICVYFEREGYNINLQVMTFNEIAKQLGIRARIVRGVNVTAPHPIIFFDMMDYLRFI